MMKSKYIFRALLALLPLGAMTSCQNSFDDPGLVVPVAKNEANITIADFKDRFAEENMQLCPYKDEESKTPYIVKGRVISSDATGNIYQTLCIQDETSAMTFAIRRAGLYDYYHVGQEIVVDLTGLWIGKFNYLFQTGWLNEDNYGAPSMGRVDFSVFQQHVELNGLPKAEVSYITPDEPKPADGMYCILENINQLPSSPGEDFYNLQGQLVEFRNVKFEGGGELPYAPYQESVNRYITQEGSGSKLTVRTSGYATFYSDILPEGTGTVRGILSYYASDPSYATTDGSVNGWQLLIRGLGDVEFDQKGQKDDPYTIEEATELQDQGRIGWVKGYIVGSAKAGANNVTSNDDIIFSTDAEMDNNLIIAASPDITDWTQCIAVDLPQGSALREYGNLFDNPAVYKREIIVSGSLTTYLGMPGVKGTGASNTFEIDGVEIGGGDTPGTDAIPAGNGTQESPYNPDQVKSAPSATGMWMEGYVVGYVADKAWNTAVFGTEPSATDNYNNATNVILSMVAPGQADASNSVPVGLKNTGDVRTTLGISKNASIYGARVKVKGEITSYFGMTSMKNVEEYVIVTGGGDTPTPPPAGDGDGTKSSPYNVSQIMTSTADNAETWVQGYVVGYAPTSYWSDAVFGNTPTEGSTNWSNGTNLILSDMPVGSASADNSIPVGLNAAVRGDLAISKNPAIYGAKVKVKGELTKYFGIRGIKNVTEFEIIDGTGGGDTPEPPVTGSTIYESLSTDANGWDMNDAAAPSGINVWQWDATYKCLKGSAYTNKINAADVTCFSPVITLPSGTGTELTFEYVFNNYKKGGNMIAVSDFSGYAYVMVREEGSGDWKILSEVKAQALAWTPWYEGKYSLDNYSGKKIQIGLRYVSTADVAGTWEVKNLKVTGSK